jgi:hypothetical protein
MRQVAAVWVSVLFLFQSAEAGATKCTTRVADPIVASRYHACAPKKLISYLHNNIVTPYSFQCAKKVQETCKAEGCDHAATAEKRARCEGRYVDVLSHCEDEIDGAAVMAKCKDSKTWPVAAIPASEPAVATEVIAGAPETTQPPAVKAPVEEPPAPASVAGPAEPATEKQNGSPVRGASWNEVEGEPERMEEVVVPKQSSKASPLEGGARTSRASARHPRFKR